MENKNIEEMINILGSVLAQYGYELRAPEFNTEHHSICSKYDLTMSHTENISFTASKNVEYKNPYNPLLK